jgi:hypothetical protein
VSTSEKEKKNAKPTYEIQNESVLIMIIYNNNINIMQYNILGARRSVVA